MKLITIAAGVITLFSGMFLADSDMLFPPVLTAVFIVGACVMLLGILSLKYTKRIR